MNYSIRQITLDELKIPIEWAAKEGWNPGLYDAESFYATDPQGFLMGFLDDEPISSISAVSYDPNFAFIGFYIVKPEYRGKGYGYALWQAAMKYLATQNIGLDGVVAQQDNYKKSGFKLAYGNIRYEGIGTEDKGEWSDIVNLNEVPFEKLLAYDKSIFPTEREAFLKLWIKQPESLAVGLMKDDELQGYGMVRKCGTGYKVGPLFANNEEVADKLFRRMRAFVGKGTAIFFDVPEVNKKAVKLAEKYNMKPMFQTARMYTKDAPNVPLEKIFGVTTFELG
ncbi:MAG TPA: GNAT family N-acetyltransferase [Patescibacteria group bacterium]